MNRLDNNPLAMALLGACGLLILIGLALTLAWRGPGALNPESGQADADMRLPDMPAPRELGTLEDYEVVLNRPVFSDTRRPQVVIEIEPVEEAAEEAFTEEVSDPPKVRLTGVVITPDARLVTLTPDKGGEALVIREGMPLEGEYVGWSVDEIEPRSVRLLSSRGQSLDFELSVYDTVIDRPPEPEPPRPATEEADPAEEGAPPETLSRADEIRERIRQRREELRAEAEQQSGEASEAQEARTNAYQDAIRSLMRGSASANDNDNDEQNENDDSGDN